MPWRAWSHCARLSAPSARERRRKRKRKKRKRKKRKRCEPLLRSSTAAAPTRSRSWLRSELLVASPRPAPSCEVFCLQPRRAMRWQRLFQPPPRKSWPMAGTLLPLLRVERWAPLPSAALLARLCPVQCVFFFLFSFFFFFPPFCVKLTTVIEQLS